MSGITLDQIKEYIAWRGGKFAANSQDAWEFALTELGEVADARIRERTGNFYLRNEPDKAHNLTLEYGDLYMMLQCACTLETGLTLEDCLRLKWKTKGFTPEVE